MGKTFTPTVENQRALRDAFGRFATGVTIITTMTDRGPIGITANSFSSVSLDPPLISWCPAKTSDRLQAFEQSRDFAVHILGSDQADLAMNFAKSGDRFDDGWSRSAGGLPVRFDCLCVLECRRVARHEAGDHILMLGQVQHVHMAEGQPLVFERGRFGRFTPQS